MAAAEYISELDIRIDEILEPYREDVERIKIIPGMDKTLVAAVIGGSTLTSLPPTVICHLGRDYLPATAKVRKKNTARTVGGNPHVKSIW